MLAAANENDSSDAAAAATSAAPTSAAAAAATTSSSSSNLWVGPPGDAQHVRNHVEHVSRFSGVCDVVQSRQGLRSVGVCFDPELAKHRPLQREEFEDGAAKRLLHSRAIPGALVRFGASQACNERPERILAAFDELKESGVLDLCRSIPSRLATPEELRLCHTEEHVRAMALLEGGASPEQILALISSWNYVYMNQDSALCARLAAGSTIACVEKVVKGELDSAAAIVRPPGHHAESCCGMGYCLYNNVAVAAKVAVENLGLMRVLVVDWDIHHGNGTQHIFEDDPRVLYFSAHEWDM